MKTGNCPPLAAEGNIQTLPADVIRTIAAGEVIDSLAAVVRELVENSLDAGATRITIALFPESWRVEVVDNGWGMSLTDLKVCANPHSTSKIRSKRDLSEIVSLGFRGEALHSLAQVADLEIRSRRVKEGEESWRVIYQKGEAVKEEPVALAPGTIVTVGDLFGSWPLRRKGLPVLSQQLKAVQGIIARMALCHPHVTWQVEKERRSWLKISPGKAAADILPQIIKQVQRSDLQLLELEVPTPEKREKAKIELVVGLPDRCHRRRADWIKVAVNGRVVRVPELEQTIISAFARTLPRDRYPLCFVHLKVAPSQIDWNRHPAKEEIYLQGLEFWQERLSGAIEEALRLGPTEFVRGNGRVGELLKAATTRGAYSLDRNLLSGRTTAKTGREIGLLQLRAVAQVHLTYIVTEHPTGIWLVEQHIAHERILYEQLQDSWELVSLETPIVLSRLRPKQLEQFERLGLDVECFGEDLWAVRTVPKMFQSRGRSRRRSSRIEFGW